MSENQNMQFHRSNSSLFLHLFFTLLLSLNAFFAVAQENPYKAPLYWSVYEHHIVKEQNGVHDNFIPESEFLANINWVDDNLKTLGYNMICIDGWGDVSQYSTNGYRTSHSRHWEHDYAWWSQHLQQRGMTLGMYGNPLWISREAANEGVKIKGTEIPLSSIMDEGEEALWFTWVQVDKPGAEEYVKGYVEFYAAMGVKYFRVDFLSWFEDGMDRNLGKVGPRRPREHYETALRWMREASEANGIFLSLVMPHMYEEASLETKYGHMTRINEDTGYGAWWKFSEKDRGHRYEGWSQYANAFDGFTYWSHIAGRGKIILDGDFIRINTFANDTEKKSAISAHLMAGGPLTISDQYNTIGNDLWLYQNEEMLALNWDGFVGKPFYNNDPANGASQVWVGQMSDGDWVLGFFNRENEIRNRTLDLAELGIDGEASVRDLWAHAGYGSMASITAGIPPHGCLILRVSELAVSCEKQSIAFEPIEDFEITEESSVIVLEASSSSGLAVRYKLLSGPAVLEGNKIRFTGGSGTVVASAFQEGSEEFCATIPVPISFKVIDPNRPNENIYLGGTFNNWQLEPMKFSDNLWVLNSVLLNKGNHELKFANTENWSGDDWGNAVGRSGVASLSTGGLPNISFIIDESGFYNIHFDDVTMEYSITSSGSNHLNEAMFVAGTFSGWQTMPMSKDENGWIIEALQISSGEHELKFANTPDWTGDDWGHATGLSGTASLATGGAPNISFTIKTSGTYTIRFNDITLAYSILDSHILTVNEAHAFDIKERIKIYPNPAHDIVKIKLPEKSKEIEVFNSLGKSFFIAQVDDPTIYLDVTEFPDGSYYVKILRSDNSQTFRKLIIQR